jgi:aminopeptidase-like protein
LKLWQTNGEVVVKSLLSSLVTDNIGDELFSFASKIFPFCRSITGDGVRKTLSEVRQHIDLQIHEVPTGTEVFDWTVPREWNIRDAYIKNQRGEKVVDFKKSNLHVMSYSIPVRQHMPFSELQSHLHTLPEQPNLIPYRTSYYSENWAFCMAHAELDALRDQTCEVVIDSSLSDGHLTYGEYLHKGQSEDEFLLSVHVCHPSLANDNCSGIALLALLGERLARLKTRLSYRFLFVPGTIGAITWLARNEARVQQIKHGLVVSMVGDSGGPTYKKSRRGEAAVDRAMIHILRHSGLSPTILDFSPYGYDERQYCSPGFNLPVGLFQRSKFGSIPEYHTSADDLEFIRPDHLGQSYRLIAGTIDVIENDLFYLNTVPKCEPQLGRRGLYGAIGGDKNSAAANMAMLWILNLSDGMHSLLDIEGRANLPFAIIHRTAQLLSEKGLLEPVASARSDRAS